MTSTPECIVTVKSSEKKQTSIFFAYNLSILLFSLMTTKNEYKHEYVFSSKDINEKKNMKRQILFISIQ